MNSSFEHITALPYRLKAAQAELQSFITGDKYVLSKRQTIRPNLNQRRFSAAWYPAFFRQIG